MSQISNRYGGDVEARSTGAATARGGETSEAQKRRFDSTETLLYRLSDV